MQNDNYASSAPRWGVVNGIVVMLALNNLNYPSLPQLQSLPTSAALKFSQDEAGSALTQNSDRGFEVLHHNQNGVLSTDDPLSLSSHSVMEADVPDTETVRRLEAKIRQFLDNQGDDFVDADFSSDDDWM